MKQNLKEQARKDAIVTQTQMKLLKNQEYMMPMPSKGSKFIPIVKLNYDQGQKSRQNDHPMNEVSTRVNQPDLSSQQPEAPMKLVPYSSFIKQKTGS